MSDLKKPESKKRNLFICDRICQSSVLDAIKEIFEINVQNGVFSWDMRNICEQ